MKSIMKKATSTILATALIVTGVYCGGTDASAAVKAKKITMNKKTVNLEVGKKFTLKVKKVTPKKGSKAVTYKTSSKKVCTVSKKGVITAKAQGNAVITVTSKSNKKAKAQVKVIVRKATPAATATPSAAPTATATATAPVVAPTATATAVAGTPTAKPTKKPTGTPKPTPTVKPSADKKPTADVIDVMSKDVAYLDLADGIVSTFNDDGSVTLDYTGTTYKGARWYFGTRTVKEENGEEVNEDVQTPLDLTGYSYLVIEGKGQDGLLIDENHDLKTQLLDATDHAEHGGLLEIDTHDLPSQLPFAFDLTGIRQDVAAFEIYSLGSADSAKAGPITITGVYICKDKAAYDKFKAGNKDDDNKDDNGGEVATPSAIDLSKADACIIDGAGTTAVYSDDNKELNCEISQYTGVIFKNAETNVDDYKYVKLTYKASAGFDAYVFNGQMGDEGKGQTPAGQEKKTSLTASADYKTVVFQTDKMYGLKIVNMGAKAKIDIKSVEFFTIEPKA